MVADDCAQCASLREDFFLVEKETFSMENVKYCIDFFACGFISGKRFAAVLQEMLDRYSAEGWRLHSYRVVGAGEICSVVFYKEEA